MTALINGIELDLSPLIEVLLMSSSTDDNGTPIGWAIQQEGKDTAITIFCKLPDFATVLMTDWKTDTVTFAYDTQNITLSCGPYSGFGDDKKRVCSGGFKCE